MEAGWARGFHSVWAGDHHVTPNVYYQSVPTIARLSAHAGRTQIGPFPLLPLYHAEGRPTAIKLVEPVLKADYRGARKSGRSPDCRRPPELQRETRAVTSGGGLPWADTLRHADPRAHCACYSDYRRPGDPTSVLGRAGRDARKSACGQGCDRSPRTSVRQ